MNIEETMPDFRKSLLDADEHLDIKINRFGGSTTPAIMWKAFFLHCTWWHKIWSPSSRYVQNNVVIEVSPPLNGQLNASGLFTTTLTINPEEQLELENKTLDSAQFFVVAIIEVCLLLVPFLFEVEHIF